MVMLGFKLVRVFGMVTFVAGAESAEVQSMVGDASDGRKEGNEIGLSRRWQAAQ